MTWRHPLVLALLPAALAGAWWLFRGRTAAETTFPRIARLWADRHGLSDAPPRVHHRARGAGLACAALLALAALARPQWGAIPTPRLQQGREVMLALDLSRSMLADDVAPTRLARAKLLVDALLDQLKGERVGLTVFAGTAFVQSPLSADYEVLRELLAGLDPNYLPQGGSNYAAMLAAASESFGAQGDGDRYLVVLSDGEAHDELWREQLAPLRQRGIRVIGLGIGTPQGALVPAADGGVTKDAQGNAVLSKLEPATLQALAGETGGAYRDAATWVDIAELVGATVAQGHKGAYVEQQHMRLGDRFQWFLAPALLLFLLSYWLEFPLFPLARAHQTRGRRPQRAVTPVLAAALAGLAAWHTPRQAQAAAADHAPPPRSAAAAPQPADLAATIAALSDKPTLAAADYARLAGDTVGFVAQPSAPRGAQRSGVIDDGLAAVARGEQADATAADWPALRQQLEALRNPPAPTPSQQQQQQQQEQQQQQGQNGNGEQQQGDSSADTSNSSGGSQDQPQNGGDSAEQQGGGENSESKNGESGESQKQDAADGSSTNGQQGESAQDNTNAGAEQADSKAAADGRSGTEPQGADEQRDTENAGGASAGVDEERRAGEGARRHSEETPDKRDLRPLDAAGLGDEQTGDPKDEPSATAPTRLVGGGQAMAADAAAQADAEAQGDMAMADALGRMRQVKQGDAPAVLFDRMNRADGQPRQTTPEQDW